MVFFRFGLENTTAAPWAKRLRVDGGTRARRRSRLRARFPGHVGCRAVRSGGGVVEGRRSATVVVTSFTTPEPHVVVQICERELEGPVGYELHLSCVAPNRFGGVFLDANAQGCHRSGVTRRPKVGPPNSGLSFDDVAV